MNSFEAGEEGIEEAVPFVPGEWSVPTRAPVSPWAFPFTPPIARPGLWLLQLRGILGEWAFPGWWACCCSRCNQGLLSKEKGKNGFGVHTYPDSSDDWVWRHGARGWRSLLCLLLDLSLGNLKLLSFVICIIVILIPLPPPQGVCEG